MNNKLVKKINIYTVGNLGTKFLSYVALLIYTYFIPASKLGYYDIVITTVALINPFICLQMKDAVYRWIIGKNGSNNNEIILTAFYIDLFSIVFFCFIYCIVCSLYNIPNAIFIGVFVVEEIIFEFFYSIVRAYENTSLYVEISIIKSVLMLIIDLFGLTLLNLGVVTLFIASIISGSFCIYVMLKKQIGIRWLVESKFNKKLGVHLMQYAWPYIPNIICWWIVNVSDRYLILTFLGSYYNGIYMVANKFSVIIKTIGDVFYLAWLDFSIQEYDNKKRNEIFSNVLNRYNNILFSLCFCLIPLTRFIIELFVSSEYKLAWQYTGFLCLGAIFSCLSSFLGVGYIISKESYKSLITTFMAAIINIIINICLIRRLSLYAASISTFLSYFIMYWVRVIHSKKYFVLTIKIKNILLFTILSIVIMCLTLAADSYIYLSLVTFLTVLLFVFINRDLLKNIA